MPPTCLRRSREPSSGMAVRDGSWCQASGHVSRAKRPANEMSGRNGRGGAGRSLVPGTSLSGGAMASEVKLPRLGQGMESGTIVKWLKAEGDRVEKGEPLYELDTDKVTQEVEAEASGILLKIAISEGEADVGTTIAVIGEQGEEVPELGNGGAPQSAEKPAEAPAREPERAVGRAASAAAEVVEAPQPVQTDGAGARIKASPLARRIARERGIELGSLKGTGPEGRVVAEDVERAAAGAPVGGQIPAVAG